MSANIKIDEKLLRQALILGNHKSENEAVNAALENYIRLHQQKRIKDLFHKIDYDHGYNYKKQRNKF